MVNFTSLSPHPRVEFPLPADRHFSKEYRGRILPSSSWIGKIYEKAKMSSGQYNDVRYLPKGFFQIGNLHRVFSQVAISQTAAYQV